MADKGEYYLRLVSVEDTSRYTVSHVHDKEYTLNQLLLTASTWDMKYNENICNAVQLGKDGAIVPGAIVLGRQSSAAVENRYSRGFASPIISREHAQLTVSRRGHVYITDLRSLHGTLITRLNETKSPMKVLPYHPTQLLHGDILILGKTVHAEEKSHAPIKLSVQFRYAKAGERARPERDERDGHGRDFLPIPGPGTNTYHFATVSDVDGIYRHVAGSHISRLAYAKVDDAAEGRTNARSTSYGLPPSVLYEDTDSDEEYLPRGYSWDTREPTSDDSGEATCQSPLSPYYSPASPMPPSPVAVRVASPRPDCYEPSEQEYDGVMTPIILSPRYEGSPAYIRTPSMSPSPSPSPVMAPPAGSLAPGTTAAMSQVIDSACHRILYSNVVLSTHSDHMGSVTAAPETTEYQVPASNLFDREPSTDPMKRGYGEAEFEGCSVKSLQTKISVDPLDAESLRSSSLGEDLAVPGAVSDHNDSGSHTSHEDQGYDNSQNEGAVIASELGEGMPSVDSEDSEGDDLSDHGDVSVHEDASDQSEISDHRDEASFGYASENDEEESAGEEDKENLYEDTDDEEDEDQGEDDYDENDDGDEDSESSGASVSGDDDQISEEEEDELEDDEGPVHVVSIEDRMAKSRAVTGNRADQELSNSSMASALAVEEVKNGAQSSVDSPHVSGETAADVRRRAILDSFDREINANVTPLGDYPSAADEEDQDCPSDALNDPDDSDLDQNPHDDHDDISMDSDEEEDSDDGADEEADVEKPATWNTPSIAEASETTVTASDLLSRQDALARLRAARAGKRVRASTPEPAAPRVDVKLEINTDDAPRHRASTYEEGLSILRAAYAGPSPRFMRTLAEVDGPSAASVIQGNPFLRGTVGMPSSSLEDASASCDRSETARNILDSPSDRSSDASSVGPVTPPTVIKSLKRTRPIEDDSDDAMIVLTPSKKSKTSPSVSDTKSSIAKTVGWVVLGAALGSAGTIAGLMRIGADSAM